MTAICQVCWKATLQPHLVNGRTTCHREKCKEQARKLPRLDSVKKSSNKERGQ
jgi:hypothetical protein